MKIRFIFILVVSLCMITAISGCEGCKKERQYSVTTFASKEKLIETMVPLFNAGDMSAINSAMIPGDFYIDRIYPHTAEGRSPGHMSGEDFWNSIINLKRPYNIKKNTEKYQGRIESIDEIGEPGHVVEFGPYKYLRHVKVKLKIKNKRGNIELIEDDDLFGIIVLDKKSGKCMFMNTFK